MTATSDWIAAARTLAAAVEGVPRERVECSLLTLVRPCDVPEHTFGYRVAGAAPKVWVSLTDEVSAVRIAVEELTARLASRRYGREAHLLRSALERIAGSLPRTGSLRAEELQDEIEASLRAIPSNESDSYQILASLMENKP